MHARRIRTVVSLSPWVFPASCTSQRTPIARRNSGSFNNETERNDAHLCRRRDCLNAARRRYLGLGFMARNRLCYGAYCRRSGVLNCMGCTFTDLLRRAVVESFAFRRAFRKRVSYISTGSINLIPGSFRSSCEYQPTNPRHLSRPFLDYSSNCDVGGEKLKEKRRLVEGETATRLRSRRPRTLRL